MPFAYDPLNPKFTFFSPVHDTAASLTEHVDHAIIALDGRAPLAGDAVIEQLNPVAGTGTLRIDLWVEELGRFDVTYGFLVSNESGSVAYARGERSVVNVDPRSHAPAPWTPSFVASHAGLIKDLPAYA
jgi:acyl-CoA thioesterase FadM